MGVEVSLRRRPRRRSLSGVLVVLASVAALSGSSSSLVFADDDHADARSGRICESSNDTADGEPGAKICFKDKGDEWYACDVDRGGSGTAYVLAAEFDDNYSQIDWFLQDELYRKWHRAEEDNADDGTNVLGDCDEGPEVNINEGHWIRLIACIEKNGQVLRNSCDHRWIAE